MSNKKKYSMLASTAAVAFILAACGNGGTDDTPDNGTDDTGTTDEDAVDDDATGEDDGPQPIEFETRVENDGDAIEGGTLSVGYVSDSPFTGIFSYELYSGNPEVRMFFWTFSSN